MGFKENGENNRMGSRKRNSKKDVPHGGAQSYRWWEKMCRTKPMMARIVIIVAPNAIMRPRKKKLNNATPQITDTIPPIVRKSPRPTKAPIIPASNKNVKNVPIFSPP